MKNTLSKFIPLLFAGLLFVFLLKIFSHWITLPEINAGDWPYYAKGMFDKFSLLAPLWTSQGGIGLGGVNADFPISNYLYFTIGFFVNTLHFSWIPVYKITWFWSSLVLGAVSIAYLYRICKRKAALWEISLAIFLYLANTYFLMITT